LPRSGRASSSDGRNLAKQGRFSPGITLAVLAVCERRRLDCMPGNGGFLRKRETRGSDREDGGEGGSDGPRLSEGRPGLGEGESARTRANPASSSLDDLMAASRADAECRRDDAFRDLMREFWLRFGEGEAPQIRRGKWYPEWGPVDYVVLDALRLVGGGPPADELDGSPAKPDPGSDPADKE
jgi:hypothetical protein